MAMRCLRKSKRAFLYMFLGIIFLTVFAFLFLTYNDNPYQDKQDVLTTRIRSMDDFIIDLQDDLDRAAFITGFRAMIAVEEYISDAGSFFDNQSELEIAFAQAFMNGTIDGVSFEIMENSSFSEYLRRVELQASLIGLSLHLTLTNVSITQATPWDLHVLFIASVRLDDASGIAWWLFDKDFETLVPIYGLKDPLYAVNTLGRVPNTINNFTLPPEGFVVNATNDTTQLQLFAQGSFYRESNESPSFLQRFLNDLSASAIGIESLVDLPSLSAQGIPVLNDRSVVDYLYFSFNPNTTTDRCQIQEMIFAPDWFRLDLAHMDDYELENMTSIPCP